ncbi:hypothethical protein (plasmid) [Ralstonia solanacearum PSI07]|nr:hypothethical protein [Ralstonia solanacearum PSI07]
MPGHRRARSAPRSRRRSCATSCRRSACRSCRCRRSSFTTRESPSMPRAGWWRRGRASSCRGLSTDSSSGRARRAPDESTDGGISRPGGAGSCSAVLLLGEAQARKAAALISQPAATQLAIQAAITAPISNHFMIVLLTTLALPVQAIDVWTTGLKFRCCSAEEQ